MHPDSRIGDSPVAPGNSRAFFSRLLEDVRADQKLLSLLAALLFTYSFFVGPSFWNQNSRFALTRAMIEDASFTIDDYHHSTGDKSWRADDESTAATDGAAELSEGHFYSDKAPGVSWLAIPAYALFVAGVSLSGGDLPEYRVVPLDPSVPSGSIEPDQRQAGDRLVYNPSHQMALYLCRLSTVTLLTLLALAALYLVARKISGRRKYARWTLFAYAMATPAAGYATAFYGHQASASFLFLAFALPFLTPTGEKLPRGIAMLAGCALGGAVACEYTAAVPTILVMLWITHRFGWRSAFEVCLGGMPWALALAAYHTAAFGHPLKTGYDFVYLKEFADGMAVRYGIGSPDLAVLGELLFGSYRGLFYLSPAMILASWGLMVMTVSPKPISTNSFNDKNEETKKFHRVLSRVDLFLFFLIIIYYILLNASYYMWDGGASLGPRHCVPILPFLTLGLIVAFQRYPTATKILVGISLIQVMMITHAGPEAPSVGNPIWDYAFVRLTWAPNSSADATTLGEVIGIPRPLSWLILVPVWLLVRTTNTVEQRRSTTE